MTASSGSLTLTKPCTGSIMVTDLLTGNRPSHTGLQKTQLIVLPVLTIIFLQVWYLRAEVDERLLSVNLHEHLFCTPSQKGIWFPDCCRVLKPFPKQMHSQRHPFIESRVC